MLAGATPVPEQLLTDDAFRQATEQVLREHAAGEGAVILGRAGAIVLREQPSALHVRLTGPEPARIEQGMRLEGVDRATAERHLQETDDARRAYVHHFYRADPRDASHYHLVIDSTAIALDACTDLIVLAARARLTSGRGGRPERRRRHRRRPDHERERGEPHGERERLLRQRLAEHDRTGRDRERVRRRARQRDHRHGRADLERAGRDEQADEREHEDHERERVHAARRRPARRSSR